MNTLGTDATRRTTKNRRREERNKARGKKGSVYEKDYLEASMTRLFVRINSVHDEAERLVEALFRRRMRERAMAVQFAFCELTGICNDCRQTLSQDLAPSEMNGSPGKIGLQDAQIKTAVLELPVIQSFARLAMLK